MPHATTDAGRTRRRRKRGRPRRDDAPGMDAKAMVARLLLADREPIFALAQLTGRHPSTLYRWARAVCESDHPDADGLRLLAQARGLWEPPGVDGGGIHHKDTKGTKGAQREDGETSADFADKPNTFL